MPLEQWESILWGNTSQSQPGQESGRWQARSNKARTSFIVTRVYKKRERDITRCLEKIAHPLSEEDDNPNRQNKNEFQKQKSIHVSALIVSHHSSGRSDWQVQRCWRSTARQACRHPNTQINIPIAKNTGNPGKPTKPRTMIFQTPICPKTEIDVDATCWGVKLTCRKMHVCILYLPKKGAEILQHPHVDQTNAERGETCVPIHLLF